MDACYTPNVVRIARLSTHIEQEFDAYLKCGRLEEGFLRLRCEDCHAEKLVAFSCKKRGFCLSCGARRKSPTGRRGQAEVLPPRERLKQLRHELQPLRQRAADIQQRQQRGQRADRRAHQLAE